MYLKNMIVSRRLLTQKRSSCLWHSRDCWTQYYHHVL